MQIMMIEEPHGTPIAIEHSLVLSVTKAEGKIMTIVVTGIMTPNGPRGFQTKESPEDVGRKVNWAREIEAGRLPYDPGLLGFQTLKLA